MRALSASQEAVRSSFAARRLACSAARRARRGASSPALRRSRPRANEGAEVARILEPRLLQRLKRREQTGLRHGQERAQQAQSGELAHRRHAGQAFGAALARLAQGDGFRLIVQMMAEQQVQDPGGAAPVAEQAIARFPGGRLDAGGGLGAGPAQDVMVDPARAQPRGDLPGFRRRLRAQTMVDDQRADGAAPGCRPAGRQQAQTQAVRAARHRDRQARPLLERAERLDQARELGRSERARRGRLKRSAACPRSLARACWMWAGAFGNSSASSA